MIWRNPQIVTLLDFDASSVFRMMSTGFLLMLVFSWCGSCVVPNRIPKGSVDLCYLPYYEWSFKTPDKKMGMVGKFYREVYFGDKDFSAPSCYRNMFPLPEHWQVVMQAKDEILFLATNPQGDLIAYASSPDELAGPYELRLYDVLKGVDSLLWRSSRHIHSLHWIGNTQEIAFLVGCQNTSIRQWGPQDVYRCKNITGTPVVDYVTQIRIEKNIMVPLWEHDGTSFYWVTPESELNEYHMADGSINLRGQADRLLAITKKSYVVANLRKGIWSIGVIDKSTSQMHDVAVLPVSDINSGFILPNTDILATVVTIWTDRVKYPLVRTLFVDLESKRMLGKVDIALVGYLQLHPDESNK